MRRPVRAGESLRTTRGDERAKERHVSRRTLHRASRRHRPGHAILPPHAHARPTPPPEDDEAFATRDASAHESVDAEFQSSGGMDDATVRGRGANGDAWEVDEDRSDVDRFLRDHFASDELELA
jgi:hypothetical protein